MIIYGKCLIDVEDISNVIKTSNGLLIRTHKYQEILLDEQGFLMLEAFFAGREKKDPDLEQMKKDIERDAYCNGYEDGYRVRSSSDVD